MTRYESERAEAAERQAARERARKTAEDLVAKASGRR
jgi:hypothetical protein